jgi:hypothetical protein
MINNISDKKLIFENELCKIYTNDFCESLTDYCERWMNDKPPLKNHKVYFCETNTGESRFVLFNEKGEPIAESFGFEGMGVEIEKLRFLKGAK